MSLFEEREMLKSLWPAWWEGLHGRLEQECVRRGIPAARWGERPPKEATVIVEEDEGEFCSSCQLRLELGDSA